MIILLRSIMAEENSKKSWWTGCGCFVVVFIVFGIGLLVAGIAVLMAIGEEVVTGTSFSIGKASHKGGIDEMPQMKETWSYGTGDVKVIRIPLQGMIMLSEDTWNGGNANVALRSIRRATHDPSVKGIILEVDSGGGGITDSDIIYNELKKFKAMDDERIIVTIMGDIAASGAYYIAITSDYIMAHPTTLTGSIGVIMQSYNFKELAQKIGVKDVTVKSGQNKDLLNPFDDVKPEQRELIQKLISAMHERFITLVAENRKMAKDKVAVLADGRVFLADEAVKNGLIDGIGYGDDARAKMSELLKTESIKVFKYEEELGFLEMLSRPGFGVNLNLKRLLQENVRESRLQYHWTL
ncbi:MAG: signal peptide peptidase SppA [bacterium]